MYSSEGSVNYYAVLGVSPEATTTEIKRAYRDLAIRYHPDKNFGKTDEAKGQFVRINKANEILSAPDKREEYDMWFFTKVALRYVKPESSSKYKEKDDERSSKKSSSSGSNSSKHKRSSKEKYLGKERHSSKEKHSGKRHWSKSSKSTKKDAMEPQDSETRPEPSSSRGTPSSPKYDSSSSSTSYPEYAEPYYPDADADPVDAQRLEPPLFAYQQPSAPVELSGAVGNIEAMISESERTLERLRERCAHSNPSPKDAAIRRYIDRASANLGYARCWQAFFRARAARGTEAEVIYALQYAREALGRYAHLASLLGDALAALLPWGKEEDEEDDEADEGKHEAAVVLSRMLHDWIPPCQTGIFASSWDCAQCGSVAA